MAKRSQMPKAAGSAAGKPRPAAKKRAGSSLVLWVALGAVAVIVAGVVLLQMQSMNKPVSSTSRVSEGTGWGPLDAPVKFTEYADFGCTYCRQFALNQGKQLQQEYEQTGKVRYEYKSFIIEGQGTRDAANAAYCAADQSRFWDYYDLLFSKSGSAQPQVVFAKNALKGYATQLGLDAAGFNKCVDNGEHALDVQTQHNEGKALGVQATPTFFVNGKKIEGAAPYTQFKATIDAALAGVGS